MSMTHIPSLGREMLKRPQDWFNILTLLFSIIKLFSIPAHIVIIPWVLQIMELTFISIKNQRYLIRVGGKEYTFHLPLGFFQHIFPEMITD